MDCHAIIVRIMMINAPKAIQETLLHAKWMTQLKIIMETRAWSTITSEQVIHYKKFYLD